MPALPNEDLNVEALRVDAWLRAHGTSKEPDQPEYWKLARRLRRERQARVAAGHVWLSTVKPETPGRLIGLKGGGERHDIILVDLQKALGPPANPGMTIMTEEQFHSYLDSRNVTVTDMNGYLAWLAKRQQALTSDGTMGGVNSPDGSVLPFGATGEQTPWGDENVVGAPTGQMASTALAVSRGYVGPLDYNLTQPFASPSRAASGRNIQTWIGNISEESYRSRGISGFGLATDPLNNRSWTDFTRTNAAGANRVHSPGEHNFPIFDFERLPGSPGASILGVQRISVKTSQGNANERQAYYRGGLVDMLDARDSSRAFQHYLRNQPGQSATAKGTTATPNPAYDVARSQILGDAYIAVNADDVVPFRTALKDATTNWGSAEYARAYGAELRENPVTIDTPSGPRTFSSVDQVNNATGLTPAELDQVKNRVGEKLAKRVVSSGITTEQVGALRASRQSIPNGMSPATVGAFATPEFVSDSRFGGGLKGRAMGAGRSSLQGGAGGSIIAVITTAGVMMIDEADHPNWESELATSGGMGLMGGATSSAIEHSLISSGSRYALSGGAATWLRPNMIRYGGGGVAAFVTAPIVEGVSMGFLEDREHSGAEIATRSVRAGGLGVASYATGAAATAATTGAIAVILGSAGTGAAGGSVVPGWGTAIGFVVGLGVGAVTYYVLDKNVPGGREDWEKDGKGMPLITRNLGDKFHKAMAPLKRQLEAEKKMQEEGKPFAAGIDEEAMPTGLGLRQDEQLQQTLLPQ